MNDIIPQYTFNKGNTLGVFLSIEDWNSITEQLNLELPQWQKDLIDLRLEQYRSHPTELLEWEKLAIQLDQEDASV